MLDRLFKRIKFFGDGTGVVRVAPKIGERYLMFKLGNFLLFPVNVKAPS